MTNYTDERQDVPPSSHEAVPEKTAKSQAFGAFLLDEPTATPAPAKSALEASLAAQEEQSSQLLNIDHSLLRGESIQQCVARISASSSPLLEAAQPLLRALSELPTQIDNLAKVEVLKQSLKENISLFTVVCEQVDIPWKKMAIVRYCLCTALDEAAHTTSWGIQSGWSQSNLLNHFEGDNDGGNKFFLLVGRLSMTPHEFQDVLDVLLRILGLGFEGRYSIIDDGARQLTQIRQRLLTLLQSTRDSEPRALSPHAQFGPAGKKSRGIFIPWRASLLIGAVLCASCFITGKYFLSTTQHNLLKQLTLLERVPAPLSMAQPRLRLRILLKEEIANKQVTLDEEETQSKIVFRGDSMFAVGATQVDTQRHALLERVAKEIVRVNGQVLVVGHSDATPINKPGLPNNKVLSEKRAASVAELMTHFGIAAENIRVEGQGESRPVASNNTAAGRASNRRVEIFVNY